MIAAIAVALALATSNPLEMPPHTPPGHCHGGVQAILLTENPQMSCLVIVFDDNHKQTLECRPNIPRGVPGFGDPGSGKKIPIRQRP